MFSSRPKSFFCLFAILIFAVFGLSCDDEYSSQEYLEEDAGSAADIVDSIFSFDVFDAPQANANRIQTPSRASGGSGDTVVSGSVPVSSAATVPTGSDQWVPRRAPAQTAVGGMTVRERDDRRNRLNARLLAEMPEGAEDSPVLIELTEQDRTDLAAPAVCGVPLRVGVVKPITPSEILSLVASPTALSTRKFDASITRTSPIANMIT